ncbi:Murein DD-endopeptidase MepM and murein hydrolase activator NlpD, contain LysM domain [Agromyces cerinus subsp. cerinus]|uniref:Murein DD-endopeptidase MepM and murein hydrolase activator NlpD, contain LysM domain n=1 Tax=Agromyces cerinus subsp. cerinus TaxID=232089 RepID=A0A1N6GPB3_9MICO|nr:Murein DD-endopeptidase MepM and murein hydrolase activator NlpD, contain LysM domain [Agromyces cerinus subsp. cerinus]
MTAAAQQAVAIGQHGMAAAQSASVAQAAPVAADASWQALVTPAVASAPAYTQAAAQAPAYAPAAVFTPAPAPAPMAAAAPVFTPAPVAQAAAPASASPAAPWYPDQTPAPVATGGLRPRRSAPEAPQLPAPSGLLEHPAPSEHSSDAVSVASALATTPATSATPAPKPQAEPVDHSVDRNSAFAVSRADSASRAVRDAPAGSTSEPSIGFDALFAGLGDETEAAEPVGRRAEASARSARPSRAERKAEKAAKATKAGKATKAVAAERPARSAAPVRPPVAPIPTPDAGASATDDFAAVIAASAMARMADSAPVPIPAPESQEFAPTSVWQPSTGVAAAEQRPRRSPGADFVGARRSTGRDASGSDTAAATPRPPAKRRVKRAGRVARMSSGFAAMSFAALLAVTTSVPSLSLLSPADVQAMALERANVGTEPGQQVEINGGALAQTVQRDGYETQTIDEYARAAGIRPEATFTNNPSGTIQWPFAVGVHIGDRFGYRDCAGCSSDHGGQDFNPGLGAEIQAIADGVVANSTDSGGSLGVVMMIDHMIDGELVTSVYAHMEYESRRFEVGDTVSVGDVIGNTGDTGMSTGPHLHFEIRLGGMDGTKVDPLDWLYANTN